jgi:hypothetical protein
MSNESANPAGRSSTPKSSDRNAWETDEDLHPIAAFSKTAELCSNMAVSSSSLRLTKIADGRSEDKKSPCRRNDGFLRPLACSWNF